MGSFFSSDLIYNIAASTVRTAAIAGGTYLLHDGIISASQTDSLVGSVLFLFGVAWSLGRHIIAKQRAVASGIASTPTQKGA